MDKVPHEQILDGEPPRCICADCEDWFDAGMTPEERKAIAMREDEAAACAKYYPKCCAYHLGFDAALSLLERSVVNSSYPVYVVGPVAEP